MFPISFEQNGHIISIIYIYLALSLK